MIKNFLNLRLLAKSDSCQTEPEVGMGATTGAGSDCYPHTIIEVADDLSYIVIQSDNYEAVTNCYTQEVMFHWTAIANVTTVFAEGVFLCGALWVSSVNEIHIATIRYRFHRRFYQDPSF